MNRTEGTMEYLQKVVKEGREFFDRHGELNLGYIDANVIPALYDVFGGIEKRHKIDPKFGEDIIDVIHYTSIGTLVSMLQQAEKNKQNASLRLYDSVHFNDPDEGNYFYRDPNLPGKYDWLGEKKESHAYIASFVFNPEKDMSDNLVFWRTYGREGEGCSLKLRIPRDQLRKVLYGDCEVNSTWKDLGPVLDGLYPALYPLVNINEQVLKETIQKILAEATWKSLARLRYLYKSKAYEYEGECRFVTPELDANKDKICFEYQEQNNSPRIRHYYEDDALKVENILTTGSLITLGPCVPHPYNMSYYIKSLLTKAELPGPAIKTSEIPYRKA